MENKTVKTDGLQRNAAKKQRAALLPRQRMITFPTTLRIRETKAGENGEKEESRTIEGYVLKFGVRSKMLGDWWRYYYEILEPGCITQDTLDKCDIKLTMFHNRELILARSNKGSGTLNYEVDGTGVKFWAEMPHTADGDKALELVGRGDLAGCSFIYRTDERDSVNCVSYEPSGEKDDDGDDILLRHVKRIDEVFDFTLAADPAYDQTTLTKREVEAAGVVFGDDGSIKVNGREHELATGKGAKKREAVEALLKGARNARRLLG